MPHRGKVCPYFNATIFRYYLRKKYKTHKSFANRIGVSRQAVDKWALGDSKPTWKHLIMMAKIFGISPRLLLVKSKQHILDRWTDHLMDFIHAPPEVVKKTKEVEILGDEGRHEKTDTERQLKLTEKGAIELTDKLGIFEDAGDDETDEGGQTIGDLFRKPKGDGD